MCFVQLTETNKTNRKRAFYVQIPDRLSCLPTRAVLVVGGEQSLGQKEAAGESVC